MKLIADTAINTSAEWQKDSKNAITLPNDADPRSLDLSGVDAVVLNFPKFTDGRAFSQAFLLRRRLGFDGTIRATGEVLVDQLLQMQRAGFTEAVLSPGQDLAVGQRLLAHYAQRCGGHYQGDAVTTQPPFNQAAPAPLTATRPGLTPTGTNQPAQEAA